MNRILIAMSSLNGLVFAQTILFTLKLCTSKVYLKPYNGFDLQNHLDSDEMNKLTIISKNSKDADEKAENLKEATNIYNYSVQIDKKQPYSEDESEDIIIDNDNLNLNNLKSDILRKRWQSSCNKAASRHCIKSCKSTYKVVCGSYRCRSKMKRMFRKECKRNCKERFLSSAHSDSDSDEE